MKLLITRKLYKYSSENRQKTGVIIFLELKWESPKQSKHEVGTGGVCEQPVRGVQIGRPLMEKSIAKSDLEHSGALLSTHRVGL